MRYTPYTVTPAKITRAGIRTASSTKTKAESPKTPNKMTKAGVKQQMAVITDPAKPT